MHMFGLGPDWLSDEVAKIAERHDATLVNHTDAQCNCGHGCNPHECRKSRRHWFECSNYGEPHNSNKAREVMIAIGGAQ